MASTGNQGADVAAEMRSRRNLNTVSDTKPKQLIALEHLLFDHVEVAQAFMVDRGPDQFSCQRPEFLDPRWIDAKSINRRWHS